MFETHNSPAAAMLQSAFDGFFEADRRIARERADYAMQINDRLHEHLTEMYVRETRAATGSTAFRCALDAVLREVEDGVAGQPGRLSEPGKITRLMFFIRHVQIGRVRGMMSVYRARKELTPDLELRLNEYLEQVQRTADSLAARLSPDVVERIKSLAKVESARSDRSRLVETFLNSIIEANPLSKSRDLV